MTVIARQKTSSLLTAIVAGAVSVLIGLCAMISLLESGVLGPILIGAWFTFVGLLLLWVGFSSWHPEGIGLAIDKDGLIWKHGTGAPYAISWDDIVGAQIVHWDDEGIELTGILVGLAQHSQYPFGEKIGDYYYQQINKMFGAVSWPKAVFLAGTDWEWNPVLVHDQIANTIAEPAARDRW